MAIAYIALGSNLDDPQQQLDRALASLAKHPKIALLAVSARYQTAPSAHSNQILSTPPRS